MRQIFLKNAKEDIDTPTKVVEFDSLPLELARLSD